jgi:hypothetical protein
MYHRKGRAFIPYLAFPAAVVSSVPACASMAREDTPSVGEPASLPADATSMQDVGVFTLGVCGGWCGVQPCDLSGTSSSSGGRGLSDNPPNGDGGPTTADASAPDANLVDSSPDGPQDVSPSDAGADVADAAGGDES